MIAVRSHTQRRAEIRPQQSLIGIRNQPVEQPRAAQVDDRKQAADHQGEYRDGLRGAGDRLAPAGIGEAQDRGDQRAGVRDADPEYGDIARRVARRCGLKIGDIQDPGVTHKYVAQVAQTDWEFLKGSASRDRLRDRCRRRRVLLPAGAGHECRRARAVPPPQPGPRPRRRSASAHRR